MLINGVHLLDKERPADVKVRYHDKVVMGYPYIAIQFNTAVREGLTIYIDNKLTLDRLRFQLEVAAREWTGGKMGKKKEYDPPL